MVPSGLGDPPPNEKEEKHKTRTSLGEAAESGSKALEKGGQAFGGGVHVGWGASTRFQKGNVTVVAGFQVKGQFSSTLGGDKTASVSGIAGSAVQDKKFGLIAGMERNLSTNELKPGGSISFGGDPILTVGSEGVGLSRGAVGIAASSTDLVASLSFGVLGGGSTDVNLTKLGESIQHGADAIVHVRDALVSFVRSGFANPFSED